MHLCIETIRAPCVQQAGNEENDKDGRAVLPLAVESRGGTHVVPQIENITKNEEKE